MKTYNIQHATLILFLIVLNSCQKEKFITVINTDLIFEEAQHINIPPYQYLSKEGLHYSLLGDSLKNGTADTVDQMPFLKWEAQNLPYVMVGIFSDTIISTKTSILNADDMVWFWHSGMQTTHDTIEAGNINFASGRAFTGTAESTTLLDTLTTGNTYMWGVWGWDKAAKRIEYSSKYQKIVVR